MVKIHNMSNVKTHYNSIAISNIHMLKQKLRNFGVNAGTFRENVFYLITFN